MSNMLSRIAERLMERARDDGTLSDLKGEKAPLPVRNGNPHVDTVTEIGYRIMAENKAVPPEVTMRKALSDARIAFKAAGTAEEKRAAMLRIADLELRCNMAAEARMRRF